MTKMKPEVKEKWLKALRSGEYKQTIRFLHTKEGFCCLGVLCDIFAKENNFEWKEDVLGQGSNRLILRLEGTDEKQVLPDHVAVWAGLIDEDGTPMRTVPVEVVVSDDGIPMHTVSVKVKGRTSFVGLTRLNDDGWTFAQIADVIEKNL